MLYPNYGMQSTIIMRFCTNWDALQQPELRGTLYSEPKRGRQGYRLLIVLRE